MAEPESGGTQPPNPLTVQEQLQAEAEQEHAHRIEVMTEVQGKIFEIQQAITEHAGHVHEATPEDLLHPGSHMDGYIRGYAEPDHDHPTVVAHHDESIAHHDPGADAGHETA